MIGLLFHAVDVSDHDVLIHLSVILPNLEAELSYNKLVIAEAQFSGCSEHDRCI